MTEHDELGGDGEHGAIHLPDPSIWPLVVGAASLFLGLALVFWTRDRGSDFSGPFLGAAFLGVMISAFGWAYEDSRMKKKAEEGAHTSGPRNARYTQVLTFAVVEGRISEARNGGIISALEGSDSALRDLNGFQDLRIIAAQSATGPSQVLVETTWSDREGLATYEETRGTLLDIVAAHPEDVATGSVQVFDMEVVRDTKDISFRFGTGAALSVLGSLVVGGFMVGAGLNLFASESEATGEGGSPPAAADPYRVGADNLEFSADTLAAPPNAAVSFTFVNNDTTSHNLHFQNQKGGTTLAPGAEGAIIPARQTVAVAFTTPGPGSYYFVCDLHPTDMEGTFTVAEGAPPPGGAAPAPGAGGSPAAGGASPAAGGASPAASPTRAP